MDERRKKPTFAQAVWACVQKHPAWEWWCNWYVGILLGTVLLIAAIGGFMNRCSPPPQPPETLSEWAEDAEFTCAPPTAFDGIVLDLMERDRRQAKESLDVSH